MTQTQQDFDDEIDLGEIIETIWSGRWLVVAITSLAVLAGGLFAFLAPQTLSGRFEVRPITAAQASQYDTLNALEFFDVTRGRLRDLFIEDFSTRETLVAALLQFGSVKQKAAETDLEYENRLIAQAYEFRLLPPTDPTDTRNRDQRPNWVIEFKSSEDRDTVRLILRQALLESQQNVRETLTEQFSQLVAVSRRAQTFRLEDLSLELGNALEDYDKKVRNRVAFLREQADIARALGIAKNTIEAQVFQAGSSVVTNVVEAQPFYLRGYEAIEKEILLIQGREQKEAFIAELIELEQKARAVEQSQRIDRAVIAFEETPIARGNFTAVLYDVGSIQFKSNIRPALILAISLVGGFFMAIVLVLIRSSLIKRRARTA